MTVNPSIEICEAHFQRVGKRVPVFRMGLYRDCFSGKALGQEEAICNARALAGGAEGGVGTAQRIMNSE